GLALQPLGGERRAGNGAAAPESFELGFRDRPGRFVHLHLQLHHVAALRRADHARPYIRIVSVERSHIARMIVMIENLVRISHFFLSFILSPAATYSAAHCTLLKSTPSFAIS